MPRSTTYFSIGAVIASLTAAPVLAGDPGNMEKADEIANADETVIVQTLSPDNEVGQITIYTPTATSRDTAVLGAFAEQKTDAYIVQDNDGELYINHLVPVENLPDPDLTINEVERYTQEYRGMTFTNKVVETR